MVALRRWLGRILTLAALSAPVLAVLPAPPAAAHGQLALSAPAKGGTVKEPLEKVRLYFTEAPAPNAYFAVLTPGGVRVDQAWMPGESRRLDEPVREFNLVDGAWVPTVYDTGFGIDVPVGYWPEKGTYTVRYATVASDNDKVNGEVTFSYAGRTSGPPAGWQALRNEPDTILGAPFGPKAATGAAPSAATAAASSGDGSGSGWKIWILPAVLVLGTGAMIVLAARRPAPGGGGRPGGKRPGRSGDPRLRAAGRTGSKGASAGRRGHR
ncbi:hypothetical protein GCM10010468_26900 [Actinocorallia longicatena]|uniref:CopC domain-containing protein n=2 Tax=Actinocorallia longicatena TaxID=111803 RepID=A0ABP6QDE6_9ACTN